jgi:hypothetical protein
MSDVLITPASGKIEFYDGSSNLDAKIELDASGNLNITNPGGDIALGDTTADVYIGDGVNNIDIVFEQDGAVRGLTGVTLTLGQSDSYVETAASLTVNGDVNSTSDKRLKENIIEINNALDIVSSMDGVYYNFIGESKRSVGLIAQNVKEMIPEAVSVNQKGHLTVSYGNLVGLLVEAIKELKQEVETLKNK